MAALPAGRSLTRHRPALPLHTPLCTLLHHPQGGLRWRPLRCRPHRRSRSCQAGQAQGRAQAQGWAQRRRCRRQACSNRTRSNPPNSNRHMIQMTRINPHSFKQWKKVQEREREGLLIEITMRVAFGNRCIQNYLSLSLSPNYLRHNSTLILFFVKSAII